MREEGVREEGGGRSERGGRDREEAGTERQGRERVRITFNTFVEMNLIIPCNLYLLPSVFLMTTFVKYPIMMPYLQ